MRAIFIVALLVLSSASAQLSISENTLYGTRGSDAYIMSTNPNEGEGGAWGSGAPYSGGSREWVFTSVQTNLGPLELDSSGTVDVSITVGGGTGEAGTADLQWSLTLEGENIAVGPAQEMTYTSGMETYTWSVSPEMVNIPDSSEPMVWRVYTANHVGVGARIGLGSDGPATLSFPVIGPIAVESVQLEAVMEDVSAPSMVLDYFYGEPTTQDWTYNWTNMNPTGNITFSADVNSGSVQLLVLDGFNDTLADVTLESTFEQNLTFEGVEGDWIVQVKFLDFQGNVTVNILPDFPESAFMPPPGPSTPTSSSSTGGSDPATFEGGNAQDESNDSPGAPIFLGLLGLALVALRRRA